MSAARLHFAPPDERQDKEGQVVAFNPTPATMTGTGPDLGLRTAARMKDWCEAYRVPMSTLRALRAQGKVRQPLKLAGWCSARGRGWCRWLEDLAAAGGSGPVSPPAGFSGRKSRTIERRAKTE